MLVQWHRTVFRNNNLGISTNSLKPVSKFFSVRNSRAQANQPNMLRQVDDDFFPDGSTETICKVVRQHGMLSLEDVHWRLSALPAEVAGFRGRGVLKKGAPADIVIYDYDGLKVLPDEIAHDLPGGEWRRVQRASGYKYILVNGQVTMRGDKPTNTAYFRQAIAGERFQCLPARPVTSSFGVAWAAAGTDFEEAYARADQALYQAKQQGRNRVCAADPRTAAGG